MENVGPYKILERLGDGGMGVVYLAVRDDDQFRKHVALKVVKRGMDSEEILHRFRSERQILASLGHDNIAGLLDGGMTDDGRPYFVMEYIDGLSINVYCDRYTLSVQQRLDLFRKVCAAVHYAHQNLVVHRDLKPSNILVSQEGQVKLLDFGIAKLLNPNLVAQTLAQTRTELRIMTPEYASPEQVRGEAITTASDVYALGVLLYELLTGHRPYRLKSRATEEIARVICEEQPEKPSTIVGRTKEFVRHDDTTDVITPEAISAARKTPIDRLRRQLSGDLDTIVLKAMHKDPQRRYASVEALSEDVQRYMEGRPVRAQKDTVGYRVRKFVRRHRLGVAAAIIVALSLIMGIGGTAWQAQVATAERDRARVETEKAEQVSAFLIDLFKGSDPSAANDGSMTAREILRAGAIKVREELTDQPEVQAQMLGVIGQVYRSLGLYDEARSALEDAIALYRNLGTTPKPFSTTLLELGNLEYRLANIDAAEPLLREAIALSSEALGPDHPDVAGIMNTLALVLEGQGRMEEARAMLRRVIAIRRQEAEPTSSLAANLNNMATMLHDIGEMEEAGAMYQESLEIVETLWGTEHPYVAFSLNSYASFHQDQGQYEQAESDFQRALDIAKNVLPEEHPFIAVVHHNLAKLYREQKAFAEAEVHFAEAEALRRKSLPADHPDIASSLVSRAAMLLELDQAAAAEPLLREAVTIRESAFDEGDWRIALAETHLARSLLQLNQYGEAESLLLESYPLLRDDRGTDDSHTYLALAALVELYTATNKPEQVASYTALLPGE